MLSLLGCQGEMSSSPEVGDFFKGTYDLVEWHQDENVYANPEISGRVSFVENSIHVTMHKRFDPKNYFTYVGFGDFKVEGGRFALRYSNALTLRGEEDHRYLGNVKESYGAGEYRWYDCVITEKGLHMVSESKDQVWNIYHDGTLEYIDKKDLSLNPIKRVWKKITSH